MPNSTGEGKGLSADFFIEHETSYTQYPSGAWFWSCACGAADQFDSREDCMAQTRKHWITCLNIFLADSALRLELEKKLMEWRELAKNISGMHQRGLCADELSTLLTEESSQVGTKEGE
jgi:hypothetical protein